MDADANFRVHKAAGLCVWMQLSSLEKAGQFLQGEPPGRRALSAHSRSCSSGRAGSGGRAPAGDSFWSCLAAPSGQRAAPPVALPEKLQQLGSASPRSVGFGAQTGLGSSVATAVTRRSVMPACSRHQASSLPFFRPCSLGIPQERMC